MSLFGLVRDGSVAVRTPEAGPLAALTVLAINGDVHTVLVRGTELSTINRHRERVDEEMTRLSASTERLEWLRRLLGKPLAGGSGLLWLLELVDHLMWEALPLLLVGSVGFAISYFRPYIIRAVVRYGASRLLELSDGEPDGT